MKMTKKILTILISAVMILGLLAGCTQGEENAPSQTNPQEGTVGTPRTDGMLVFSSDASLNITYDEEGLVISIEGTNAEGISLTDEYTDFLGKSCAAVVKDLVAASINNDYFTKNIVIKQAIGSALPGTNFLDTIASEAQAAADTAEVLATVILISEEDLDADGYIGLATAKKILMSHLGIDTTTVFDGDTSPIDGTYTFYVDAEAVDGYFSVNAVTGIAATTTEDDIQVQEDMGDETFPQNEEIEPDTIDNITSSEQPQGTEASTVPEANNSVEDTTIAAEEDDS